MSGVEDPFESGESLAKWAASILNERGVDRIANWRMLEYWMNVELYRATQDGKAGPWRHLGDYEQPYETMLKLPGRKTGTKWIDLVLAEPTIENPARVVWTELKDLGRNVDTIKKNAKGLGWDLAALWGLRPDETQRIWLDPPKHAIDRGRSSEWKRLAPGIRNASHLIAQIVIIPIFKAPLISVVELEDIWLTSFVERAKTDAATANMVIGRAATEKFAVRAVVRKWPG